MALRLKSLKTRTALAIASVVVVTLVVNAVYLILRKKSELRGDIERETKTFAELTKDLIATGWKQKEKENSDQKATPVQKETPERDFYKFRELVRNTLRLNTDVERILIVDTNGRVLFDSSELDELDPRRGATPPDRWIQEPSRVAAIQAVETKVLPALDFRGEPGFEIVAPYIEDFGRHPMSVLYQVSYKSLKPKIAQLAVTIGALTLLSILASVLVAAALASRITRPVQELTEGAKDIAKGHFDRRLSIDSSEDELRILAEAFNHMTGRLKENVEKLEESNVKLGAANEELKELDRLKSDLLANVSHELRTPLTAIKGYTDYILEKKLGPISEKQEKGLIVVQRNLDRLSKSINALLDFSRMDVGRISLNIQPFLLGPLVEQIHTSLRSELEKKHLAFRSDLEPELPAVIADREKVSAVLENLIINAIKFTPEGGSIAVSAARQPGAARPSAEIRVADTGVGIPPDQIGKVFNRFHQVDGSSTRRFGGVGLGLAIVKSILEAHGTTIEVVSQPGHGTAFRFVLPVLEKQEVQPREERPRGVAEGGLVLVMAEEADALRQVRGALEADGLSALGASTAAEAAALVAERRPEAVLVDVGPPAPEGWELLRRLCQQGATRDLPVVAYAEADEGLRVFSLGPRECVAPSVDATAIAAWARRLVSSAAGEPTVLLLDGEPDTAARIRDTLRSAGCRVIATRDRGQARASLQATPPDLVVVHAGGTLAGLEVLAELGRDHALRAPVLLLGGREETSGKRGRPARRAGRILDPRPLLAEVRRHVSREGAEAHRASV
jgi:signal transduction histidine kinase/DNA-binding response OmpR family regulator